MTEFSEFLGPAPLDLVDAVHSRRVGTHSAGMLVDGALSVGGRPVVSFANAELSVIEGYDPLREQYGSPACVLSIGGVRGESTELLTTSSELRNFALWLLQTARRAEGRL